MSPGAATPPTAMRRRHAEFEGRLYNLPIWSTTQLLWYRKDRVRQPPETWDEMLAQSARLGADGDVTNDFATA